MQCSCCGSENNSTKDFCRECGHSLLKNNHQSYLRILNAFRVVLWRFYTRLQNIFVTSDNRLGQQRNERLLNDIWTQARERSCRYLQSTQGQRKLYEAQKRTLLTANGLVNVLVKGTIKKLYYKRLVYFWRYNQLHFVSLKHPYPVLPLNVLSAKLRR